MSLDLTIRSLIARHAEALEEIVVDDWDQSTGYGLLSRVSTLPNLPELKRLALGGAGLGPDALGRLECPRLETLEVDDLRGSFRAPGALIAAMSVKGRSSLKRVYCAGDALEPRRGEISEWGRNRGVLVEWGHRV